MIQRHQHGDSGVQLDLQLGRGNLCVYDFGGGFMVLIDQIIWADRIIDIK
jgi:hypothetical protein